MLNRRKLMQGAALGACAAATGGAGVAGVASAETAPQAPAATPRDNPFGINMHLERFSPELGLKQLAMARAMGVGWVRGLTAAWGFVQPKPTTWAFDRPDRDLAAIETMKLEPLGMLGPSVAWAAPMDPRSASAPWGWSNYPPGNLDEWGEYVTRVVTRYKGRVRYWQPWNEPDGYGFFMPAKDAAQKKDEKWLVERRKAFLDIQRATYKAVKAADPGAKVLSAGFAMGGDCDAGFVGWLMANGAGQSFDIMDFHMYWSLANVREALGKIRRWMGEAGLAAMPVWMTEAGASLRTGADWIGPYSHADVANFVPKLLATTLAMGVQKVFLYQDYTEGNKAVPLENSEFSFNVTDGPAPAAWSATATVRLLRDAKFLGEAALEIKTGKAVGYRVGRPEGDVLILWASSPENLENRPAHAEGTLAWLGATIPLLLSERPTILVGPPG
jgi:hypothetical protein